MRGLRGNTVYPGAYRRVVLREEALQQRGLLQEHDWLEVRQLKGHDFYAIEKMRMNDRAWLAPWEAGAPPGLGHSISMDEFVKDLTHNARTGQGLYFGVLPDGRLAGQISLSSVHRGAEMGATLGYWINSRFAGRGIIPLAVAMVIDWALMSYGLHRLEINIRPENAASLRVVEKLGLRYEGLRQRLLYIDGGWRDHKSFAITTEEWEPGAVVARLENPGQG